MTSLRAFLAATSPASLAAGGFVIGFLFGAIAQRSHFCAMGAVSDAMSFGDTRRMRSWLLAAAVAILGVHVLEVMGALDTAKSMYRTPRLNWAGHVIGGTLFGFGMVFAGGCASRNLVRAGAGDLRSFFTLMVTGVFAGMAAGGLLGPMRAGLERMTAVELGAPSQGLADVLGLGGSALGGSLPVIAAALLSAYALASPKFRASRMHVLSGLGVGLVVVAGWALTGLAYDDMADRVQPPVSLTFVKSTADTIEWLERYTAQGWPGFGAASVLGVLAGAWLMAALSGRLRIATFADPADTLRHLGGAALMGTGGVMALGCSVGQGLSGVSTLAVGSILSFAAIAGGAALGLKALERSTD